MQSGDGGGSIPPSHAMGTPIKYHTPEERKHAHREAARICMAKARLRWTPEQKARAYKANSEWQSRRWAAMTPEERAKDRARNTKSRRLRRHSMTPEENEIRKAKRRAWEHRRRESIKNDISQDVKAMIGE